jgi:hypothetical protein
MTFTGTLAQLEARGATGVIFGTMGYDVERELRAHADVAGLRSHLPSLSGHFAPATDAL